jgi:predicted RNase H-like HicB family nuclease
MCAAYTEKYAFFFWGAGPGRKIMETMINLHIEQLPEGYYLATSSDVQGLVAQGRTIAETLEIARDVARRLIEAQTERNSKKILRPIENTFDLQVVVGC